MKIGVYPGTFDPITNGHIDIIKRGTNLFGNTKLTGVDFNTYYNEKAASYHWLPLDDFTEVDKYGSTVSQDDIVYGGESYVINNHTYQVKEIDIVYTIPLQILFIVNVMLGKIFLK